MFVNFRLIVQDFYLVEVRFLLLRPIFILTVNIYFLRIISLFNCNRLSVK